MEIPKEIKGFFDNEGKIKQLPSKMKKKLLIIDFLSEKFEMNVKYSGQEIDEILNQHHTYNDSATLRRELISNKILDRTPDGRTYWKIEK